MDERDDDLDRRHCAYAFAELHLCMDIWRRA